MRPIAVEFLVHMSLSAAVASANHLADECLMDEPEMPRRTDPLNKAHRPRSSLSQSAHVPRTTPELVVPHRVTKPVSVTGARLDLQWRQLTNVEYLTDGGNSWIHTAVFDGKSVVVKTLKPECQDVVHAINEIESELGTLQCCRRRPCIVALYSHHFLVMIDVHSRLNHPNIVSLIGAGTTSKGVRFMVLERLDGGTLTQMLGYDTRIRDRRRRFWRKKQFSYLDVLRCARSIADAMQYCQAEAIPGSVVLHRDLKPDNIGALAAVFVLCCACDDYRAYRSASTVVGFTLSGMVKVLDFGLATVLENASPNADDVYEMSGETGSVRELASLEDGYCFDTDAVLTILLLVCLLLLL